MDVVYLHCHFERGGVTQVVCNHLSSLLDGEASHRILLISGNRASGLPPELPDCVQHARIEGFDYDSERYDFSKNQRRAKEILQRLKLVLQRHGFAQNDTVLHWHNHSLGKNTALPVVVRQLALAGWRSLLQIHDFAEDYRPDNYARLIDASGARDRATLDQYLYPVAETIHYATLTHTDASVLCNLGIPGDRVGVLPNNVFKPPASFHSESNPSSDLSHLRRCFHLPDHARWCLYPVRGIRRKNLGEYLLLSELNPESRYSGLTLSPTTSVEAQSYSRWKKIARDLAPRLIFDTGKHPDVSFRQNMCASDLILSTSVAEGFGMAFLEPWLLGREVIARRLQNVVPDFEQSGIDLRRFYDAIMIPGNSGWLSECRREWSASAHQAWAKLPDVFRPKIEAFGDEGTDAIDFALLCPQRQVQVLEKYHSDNGFRKNLRNASADLIGYLHEPIDPSVVEKNSDLISECYGIDAMRQRLVKRYKLLLASSLDDSVTHPSASGEAFKLVLKRQSFFPCRTEEEIS